MFQLDAEVLFARPFLFHVDADALKLKMKKTYTLTAGECLSPHKNIRNAVQTNSIYLQLKC